MGIGKRFGAIVAAVGILAGASACATIAPPDEVGLYYMEGNSDGYKFGMCIDPGATGDAEWNNSVIYLPTSLRTWNIGGEGSDQAEPIISASKPQEGQPSGVEVQVWPKVTFKLNTFCDKNGGVIVPFWENIGRRYKADTPEGWKDMLLDAVVPALEKVTREVTIGYTADVMVGNIEGVYAKIQTEVASRFAVELKRMSGGDYFCGPTFSRASKECPTIEVIIKGITYRDPGIQNARNEKQKAVELAAAKLATAQGEAAALVAEATGKKNAATELAGLYSSPGWVELQKKIIEADALVKACQAAKECRLIVGSDGNLIMQ